MWIFRLANLHTCLIHGLPGPGSLNIKCTAIEQRSIMSGNEETIPPRGRIGISGGLGVFDSVREASKLTNRKFRCFGEGTILSL